MASTTLGTQGTHEGEGILRRGWRWLVGSHPHLREAEGHTSWLSYLLMIVQSMTLVLIGGSVELRTVLSNAPLPEKAVLTLSLAILVLGTYAADMATQRTMGRVSYLLRNRRTWLASEHILYATFVYAVEAATFAVALYVIETNPQALLSGVSILPNSRVVILVMVGVRALIIVWTSVQLKIIAEPLPPNELTLMRRGVEKAGGHADQLLDNLQLTTSNLPDALHAIAEMSKPPRRIPHWYNGWLRARDAQVEREQDALLERQIAALRGLSRDEIAETRATYEQALAQTRAEAVREAQAVREAAAREVSAAQERVRQLTETAQRQIAQANDAATQRTLDAVLSLIAGGKLPEWLVAQRPDLADFTLATATGANGRRAGVGVGGKSGVSATREPSSRADKQRTFLIEQGIEPSSAPEGKRGVWLRASDLTTLTSGRSSSEKPQDMIRRLGDGQTVGRNLVAPFEPVMRELAERHLLSDAARIWWASQIHGSEDDTTNVIPMRA